MLARSALNKGAVAILAAGALAVTMTACGSDDKSDLYHSGNRPGDDPNAAPGQYIDQVDGLIDQASQGKLTANEFERQVANVYCAAERTFGEQSNTLFQVVQTPNDAVGNVYMNLVDRDGYEYPEDMGYLADMISQVGFHTSTDSPITGSFCIVAKGGVLPSAKVKKGAPPVSNADDNALMQQLKDGYSSARDEGDIIKVELKVKCTLEQRYGMGSTPSEPGANPALAGDIERIFGSEAVNNKLAKQAQLTREGKDSYSDAQMSVYNRYNKAPYELSACQASKQFNALG